MTANYWVSGVGKCAQSALVDQISRATGHSVWGHSPQRPYSHQPNTVVHTNLVELPQLPYNQYHHVLVVRRDVIHQVMENWCDRQLFTIDVCTARLEFKLHLKRILDQIHRAHNPQWHSRTVIHTEDFLTNHTGVLQQQLNLHSAHSLAPNLQQLKPWQILDNYTQLRSELSWDFEQQFEQINSALKVYLNAQS